MQLYLEIDSMYTCHFQVFNIVRYIQSRMSPLRSSKSSSRNTNINWSSSSRYYVLSNVFQGFNLWNPLGKIHRHSLRFREIQLMRFSNQLQSLHPLHRHHSILLPTAREAFGISQSKL